MTIVAKLKSVTLAIWTVVMTLSPREPALLISQWKHSHIIVQTDCGVLWFEIAMDQANFHH